MITAIGILFILIVFVWDGIVIFFLDGDIENLFEEDELEEPEKPEFPECQKNCNLRGSDYCIYKCWVEQEAKK